MSWHRWLKRFDSASHCRSAIFLLTLAAALGLAGVASAQSRQVVAYWGLLEDYEFDETLTKLDFPADVDATAAGDARLEAFLGDPENLDHNGGSGFEYTSPISGLSYDGTRTIKYDDVRGGGDEFDIADTTEFSIDRNDGMGPQPGSFGNDGLMYVTLDGSGWTDFELRFDIEGAPDSLPNTFDIFYRVGGAGPWFREASQNNIPLSFADYDPPDPDNQFASSGQIMLPIALNGQSQIQLMISDFAENGNGEMEIDNIEISALPVPEPSALVLIGSVAFALLRRRR